MVKLVVFDLDGVLVNSRDLHYKSLNLALNEVDSNLIIPYPEHLAVYDGLPTKNKLEILTNKGKLDQSLHHQVWKSKQHYTQQLIQEIQVDPVKVDMIKRLKADGFTIYCASNSVFKTMTVLLSNIGVLEHIDYFLASEDVARPKPHPDIYYKCLTRAGVKPTDALIVEDSPIGRAAAFATGAHVLEVDSVESVTYNFVRQFIDGLLPQPEKPLKWQGAVTVVIPMAGRGSRFEAQGYAFPKPLIDVNNRPMIQVVVDNLRLANARFVFIVQRKHLETYCLNRLLNLIAPQCQIVVAEEVTQGAACTLLLAEKHIDNDSPLLIANSDQYLEWDPNSFMYSLSHPDIDAGISVFNSTHPKWSFAKLGPDGFVSEVAEKKPISNIATTGIYYWKHGRDFIHYAKQMISKNIRVKGEFYVCPIFNEAIGDGKKIKVVYCTKMWGLGTPEDLTAYLSKYKRS